MKVGTTGTRYTNGFGIVVDGKRRVIRQIIQNTDRHLEAYYQKHWIFIINDPECKEKPFYAYVVHPNGGQLLDKWFEGPATLDDVLKECLTNILTP